MRKTNKQKEMMSVVCQSFNQGFKCLKLACIFSYELFRSSSFKKKIFILIDKS